MNEKEGYPVCCFLTLYADFAHVNDDRSGTLCDIAVDDGAVLEELVSCKATLVDDFHLFDDGALAGLS